MTKGEFEHLYEMHVQAVNRSAAATGVLLTGGHAMNVAGIYAQYVTPVRPKCAYCGMNDFAHHQCQRCGASEP